MNISFPIHETFQQTVQGEGALMGCPADFIRLYGCPVGCAWCDTGYSDGGKSIAFESMTATQLVSELKSPLVVITGGEPFIHQNLGPLCEKLLNCGKKVSIETSGIRWREIPESVWVTLSPKEHLGKSTVAEEMWLRANEIKLVIAEENDFLYYQERLQSLGEHKPVFLQPEWHSRESSLPLVLKLLQTQENCRLSVQMHKFLQVP